MSTVPNMPTKSGLSAGLLSNHDTERGKADRTIVRLNVTEGGER